MAPAEMIGSRSPVDHIECLFVSRGGAKHGVVGWCSRPGSGWPEEPVFWGVFRPRWAAEPFPYCPPGPLTCAWARRASARRRVKTASLTCRFRARRASLRVFPSASFLS